MVALCQLVDNVFMENAKTFPVLEALPRNGAGYFAISHLIRGSAITEASAISLPWSCMEVSTKAFTFAEAKAGRSVIL